MIKCPPVLYCPLHSNCELTYTEPCQLSPYARLESAAMKELYIVPIHHNQILLNNNNNNNNNNNKSSRLTVLDEYPLLHVFREDSTDEENLFDKLVCLLISKYPILTSLSFHSYASCLNELVRGSVYWDTPFVTNNRHSLKIERLRLHII